MVKIIINDDTIIHGLDRPKIIYGGNWISIYDIELADFSFFRSGLTEFKRDEVKSFRAEVVD